MESEKIMSRPEDVTQSGDRSSVGTLSPLLWYTVAELEAFGISNKRLREWRRKKGLKAVKLKKLVFWGGDLHEILLSERSEG